MSPTALSSVSDGARCTLPPRPSSICQECWEGPFAMHFGLPCKTAHGEQLYRRWPSSHSSSTTLVALEARASAGCVWCRFLIVSLPPRGFVHDPTLRDRLFEITVRGAVEQDADCSPKDSQSIYISVNGQTVFAGLVHTAPDDPAAPHIVMRSPIVDVGSPRALALARECIDECVQRHDHCNALVASPDSLLPTRLIDCSDPAVPHLAPSNGRHGRYLTLSYVWGGDQAHKTTLANVSAYERGIDPSLLPQTIRDAIRVTHALGFHLLWVDSLCIIQNSDEDKRRELGRMHHIYRYAHLTIIASSAERVSDGFLQDRPPAPQMDFDEPFSSGDLTLPFICPQFPAAPAHTSVNLDVIPKVGKIHIGTRHISHLPGALWPNQRDAPEPISTRGWCLQEYLMSPRSLIFTSKTVQYRCLTTTQNVGNSLRDTIDEMRLPSTLYLPDPPLAEPGSAEWEDVHEEWLGVLADYSRRTTSLPSDKLVACAAVAEQFHRVLRSDYLAGMWRDTLLLDLLWCRPMGGHVSRPTEYRAPSWSWASVEGELSWRARGPGEMAIRDENAFAKVVRCEVTLEDNALPFGRVTGGTLVLHAPLLQCRLRTTGHPKGSYDILLQSVHKALGQSQSVDGVVEVDAQLSGLASVDCESEVDVGSERTWAIPLVPRGGFEYTHWMEGLVVARADSNGIGVECGKAPYRRLGYFSFTFEESLEMRGDPDSRVARKRLAEALYSGEYPSEDIELV